MDIRLIQLQGHPVFIVLPEMVYGRVDHDLSEPAFEGIYRIRVRRFEPVYLDKHLEKTVIQDFSGVFVVICIPVADRHSISIEGAVDFFLALPTVQGTTPDVFLQFLLRQQICVGLIFNR